MLRRAALAGPLLVTIACGGRNHALVTAVLPPVATGRPRCEVVQPLAQTPVAGPLRSAEAFAITGSGADAVFVHVKTRDGELGHGRLIARQSLLELVPGVATAAGPALFIDYEDRQDHRWTRLLLHDLHDPSFVRPVPEASEVAFPSMSAGADASGLLWFRKEAKPERKTLMFAELDAARRVHAAHPLVSGRLDFPVGIVGTPSGYAVAYLEEIGRYIDVRLIVLMLDPSGLLRERVVIAEGRVGDPRMVATSQGITVVYQGSAGMVRVLLGFDGRLQSPARALDVSGDISDIVVHRDEAWFAIKTSYCFGCSFSGWSCDAPPEAAAFHLARDGAVTRFELVHGGEEVVREAMSAGWPYEDALDGIDFNAAIGDIVLGSVGERLLAAWTITREPRRTPTFLKVAELSCPADPTPE